MKKTSPILLVSVISLGLLSLVYAATTEISISGLFGVYHSTGSFDASGNAGTVTLIKSNEETLVGGSGVYLVSDGTNNTLTGNLYLQTVGWVHLGEASYPVTVTPPADTTNLALPWEVNGYAWGENAGWITFQSLNSGTYSGVYYLPSTGSFTGLAWSDTLGYIDFSGNGSPENSIIGGVKILGNAGGTTTYDSLYVSSNGLMKTNSVLTPFINTLRKNIAILTRNAPANVINTTTTTQNKLGELMYYRLNGGGILSLSSILSFCTADNPRSVVVEGGDILIDRDVTGSTRSCAIIALSDGTTGGNVYLAQTPKKIESYIIAEGSLFAGTNAASLYNDTKVEIPNLPQSQLYVHGGIISHNTIGGSTTTTISSGACPYTEATCDRDTALKYDLNFFRNYKKDPSKRAYKNDSLDNYSFIIEYDARSAGDPPPGL